MSTGAVDTIGDFQGYDTEDEALQAIEDLA